MSNLSASTLEIGIFNRTSPGNPEEKSTGSGKKGISMLEATSESRRPNI
jgi:hypothetical protein